MGHDRSMEATDNSKATSVVNHSSRRHGELLKLWSPQHLANRGSAAWNERVNSLRAQKHLRCTMVGPDSSYSPLEIHICWKVLKDDRMEPPIHTEYLRSGGATTLIFIVEGARAVSSLVMRSPMP